MSKKFLCFIFLSLILFTFVEIAFADEASVDSAIEFAAKISSFSDTTATAILNIARRLFIALATLSLALGLIRMLLTGESNVGSVIAHVAKWILYVGIFTWMMSSLSSASFIPKIIINSFVSIAGTVGGSVEIAPDDILASGIRIYGIIVERGWNAGWGDFLGITFIGIIILVVIAMIAGYIAVAIVEMHLIICGGAVLLGFGGFEYTRDIALSYLRYAISVGIKLLMITIVYSLAVTLLPNWEDAFKNSSDMSALITGAGQILGGSICILIIVRVIPNIAQSIVNNAAMSFGHNAPIVGHSVYTETRVSPNSWQNIGSNIVQSVANSFRGSRNSNNNTQISGYTARADEVFTGGTGFNPTQINSGSQTENRAPEVRPETFERYVTPGNQQNSQRIQTTTTRENFNARNNRNSNIKNTGSEK
ncbi:MAG: P-type conjugative transfer protein TrbL [Synergistaceae bacterium]|nr:P-type conjugative transfer protein TrbL [Synergistaceae bacterium]